MTIVKRVPVTTAGPDFRSNTTWPSHLPGDHTVKLSVNLDYSIVKVALDMEKKKALARKLSPSRKRPVTEDYKRLYLTYSIGGQIEGKTDVLGNANGSWTGNHEVTVGAEFLSNIYQKPTEFVVWEVRRLDEAQRRQEKEELLFLSGKHPHYQKKKCGLADFSIKGGPIDFNAASRKKSTPFAIGGSSAINGTSSHPQNENKIRMTVAQTGLTRKQKMKHASSKHTKDDLAMLYEYDAELDIRRQLQEDLDLDQENQNEAHELEDSDMIAALHPKDFSHLGEEVLEGMNKAMQYKSLSSPDLTALLNESTISENLKKIPKRAVSEFPMDHRYRPGSSLHRFLHEDFGIRTNNLQEMHPLGGSHHHTRSPSNQSRQGPHPHHFNHPEKHIPAESIRSGMVRSRSSSSLSSLHQLHPKTPPSPHHSDHPLTILAPRGKVNENGMKGKEKKLTKSISGEKSTALTSEPNVKRKISSRQKQDGGTLDTKKTNQEDHKGITKTVKVRSAKLRGGDKTDSKAKSDAEARPNTTTDTKSESVKQHTNAQNARRRIRWDPQQTGIYTINWKELPLEEAERRANDQPILLPSHEKHPVEKRKGDFAHIPVARMLVDVTGLFFDELEANSKIEDDVDGITKCDIAIKLEAPLLSSEQVNKLKPMLIHLEQATDMPSQPVSFEKLDELCHPVSAKFRFFSDNYIHTAIASQQNHGPQINFNSRHLVLAGLMDPSKLRDSLVKDLFHIEIHDRDYKLPGDLSRVFAELRSDGLMNCSLNPLNPHGLASFSLFDLCNGATTLELSVPILPGKPHPSYTTITKASKQKQNNKAALPAGRWLEHGTMLNLRIESRLPLVSEIVMDGVSISKALYGHVILVTKPKNSAELSRVVHQTIVQCNAHAVGLDCESDRLDLDLSTFLLTDEQKNDPKLDIMTGYDIFDATGRVFFIEGLLDGGLAKLLDALNRSSFELYHSPSISFYHRCWKGMTPTLTHIRLNKNVSELLATTAPYTRNRMRPDVYACLNLIQTATQLGSLSMQSKMSHWFPTQKMIVGLIGSYGQVISYQDTTLDKYIIGEEDDEMLKTKDEKAGNFDGRQNETIDVLNRSGTNNRGNASKRGGSTMRARFSNTEAAKDSHPKKILSATTTHKQSETTYSPSENHEMTSNQRQRYSEPNFVELTRRAYPSKAFPRERSTQMDVFNYSIQSLSTTSDQLLSLRERLSQDKSVYRTFNANFFSQTISPVDLDEEKKLETIQSRMKFLTEKGFDTSKTKPGANETPLTDSRKQELQQPWTPPKPNFLFS